MTYTADTTPAPDDKVRIHGRDRNGTPWRLTGTIVTLEETTISLATKDGPVIVKAESIDNIARSR